MHRVRPPIAVDGAARRHQRLREHLAAVEAHAVGVEADAAEEVDLERLEVEEADEIVERTSSYRELPQPGHPKNTPATSSSSGSTVLSSRTASAIGHPLDAFAAERDHRAEVAVVHRVDGGDAEAGREDRGRTRWGCRRGARGRGW